MVKITKTPEGPNHGHFGVFRVGRDMNIMHKNKSEVYKNPFMQKRRKFLLALCRLKWAQIAPNNPTGEIFHYKLRKSGRK